MEENHCIGWVADQMGLTFDYTWYRVRIFRRTLEELGNPEFFRFLFHPVKKLVAVQACGMDDQGSHLRQTLKDGDSYEISSKDFVELLYRTQKWDRKLTYRLEGVKIPNEDVVVFPLEDAIRINERKCVTD